MISQNAGFDSTDILNKLRQKHHAGGKYYGVDIMNDGICDTYRLYIDSSILWETCLCATLYSGRVMTDSLGCFA